MASKLAAMKLIGIIPNKRWFRFSLRSLFIVITAFACWLGYYVNWIRDRHQALNGVEYSANIEELNNNVVVTLPPPHPFPWSLTVLGEQPVNAIAIPGSKSDPGNEAKIASFARLFPEADVICISDVPPDDSEDAPQIGLRP